MPSRTRDYAILLAITAALTLPYLGGVSLWDVDEAVNAQAAREMQEADTWVIPTFNYQLRTAKPVMLYWLQRTSYAAFGVSEWSARFPSVIASWLIVLLTYELTRQMFGRSTGLLAGVVLASACHFAILSHAATPDATLLLFTVLAYFAFWSLHKNGSRAWWVPTAAACGLAILTKGPVGVALPGLVIFLYFAWNRELGRLLDRRLLVATVAFILVAAPWYGLVASETRGEWLTAFFGNENVNRFLNTMEGHGGKLWYYPGTILALFIPWSAFLIAALWYGVKAARTSTSEPMISDSVRAHRFLVCWVVAYLAFFTIAATKLPNYVFPLYPALAILIARFLTSWRDTELTVPRWLMPAGAGGLLLVGIGVAGVLFFADRTFPGLGVWATLGIIPTLGGIGMAWCLRHDRRHAAIQTVCVTAVVFIALFVTWVPGVLERQRAPRELVRASGLTDPDHDLRIATYEWFQPSVVFYTGREVGKLNSAKAVTEFLAVPTPGYLFVPAPVWDEMKRDVTSSHRVVAQHPDFLKKCDIVVVTNVPSADVAAR